MRLQIKISEFKAPGLVLGAEGLLVRISGGETSVSAAYVQEQLGKVP